MKFKKLTVLALVACLAFTACGKEKESNRENEEPSAQTSVVTEPSEVQEPSLVTEPSEAQEDPGNTGSSASAANGSSTYLTEGTAGDYTYEIEPNFAAGRRYYDLSQRGYIWDSLEEMNAPVWITITSGEQSTGGYDINVVNIEADGDTVTITVEETSPEPTQMVTEALTYPCTTVRFDYGTNGTPHNFVVVNTAGEEFSPID